MSFDINILVNGNRCKQYQHQGKTYIEAKNGSEYAIEIKNNHYQRILSVGSVDGLNVLTGKTATDLDSGYIIPAYSAEKIKGFRISDDEWALFKFGYKFNGKTYAQSKEDGSEKNCGVIGLRLFYEKLCQPIYTYTTYATSSSFSQWNGVNDIYDTCDWNTKEYSKDSSADYKNNVNYTRNLSNTPPSINYCSTGNSTKGMSSGLTYNRSNNSDLIACAAMGNYTEAKPFDMGTEFGRRETSKVKTVDFEKGVFAQGFDVYYASRESLIAMGVPIGNQLTVSLPQSFPEKYAKPPKGWTGY